mgnify:FL=1
MPKPKVALSAPGVEGLTGAFDFLGGLFLNRGTEAFRPGVQDEDYVPPVRPASEELGRRIRDILVPAPETAMERAADPWVAPFAAFPPGVVVSGGVSAAVREAGLAFRALRAVARVSTQAAETASAAGLPRGALAASRRAGLSARGLGGIARDLAPERVRDLARAASETAPAPTFPQALAGGARQATEGIRFPRDPNLVPPRTFAAQAQEAAARARVPEFWDPERILTEARLGSTGAPPSGGAAVPPAAAPPPLGGAAPGARYFLPGNASLIRSMNLHGDSVWQRLADQAARVKVGDLRPLMPIIDRINFRALAEGPVKEAMLVHANVAERYSNLAASALQDLRAIGDVKREFGLLKAVDKATGEKLVQATKVTPKHPGDSLAISDIIELGEAAYNFTPKQKAIVAFLRNAMQEVKAAAKAEGIPFDEITFLEPGREYFPRWVTAISKVNLKRGFGGTLQGYKQSFQKTRFYDLQIEGMRTGVDYALPEQALATHIQAVGKAIAEKRMYQMVAPFAQSPQSLVSVAYKQPVADTRVAMAQLLKLERVTQRLIRGEKIPTQTVEALKRTWPALGHELGLANDLQNAALGRELLKKIRAARPGADRAMSDARRAYDAQVETQKAMASLGDRGIEKHGLMHVYGRAFGAKNIFPIEIGKPLQKAIDDRANEWLATMNRVVTGTLLPLQAGMDFSAPFIQGLPALVTHPARWATATVAHYKAFLDPGTAGKYFARHPGLADEMLEHNVSLSSAEFYEGGLLRRVPGVKRVAQGFEEAFDSFGDVLRGELWLAQKQAASKFPDGLDRLAEFVNKSTGTLSTRGLGIGATQREIERGFLFFAPRYTRAYLGLMADVARGGYAGTAAREALGRLAAAGVGASTLVALAQATGKEGFDADKFWEEWAAMLNPTSDHFLSLSIGGNNYGVGGVVYSALKHAGRALALEIDNPGAIFNFDPKDDVKNPLSEGVGFWRSRVAPVGSLTWDLGTGYNYIGESTRGWGNLATTLAERVLPFAVSGRVLETPREGWATYPLDVTGLRVSPRSPWTMANDARDVAAQAMFGKRWRAEGKEGLTNEQRRIINNLPDIEERRDWAEQVTREKDRDPEGIYQQLDAYQQKQGEVLERRQERVAEAEVEYRRLRQDKGKLREHYRTIQKDFFLAWDALGPSPAEKLRTQKEPHPLDLALERYFEAIDARQFTNRWDEVDWDAYDRGKGRALAGLSPSEAAYVERQRLALKSPLEREYDAAKQYKRSYDEAWKRVVGPTYQAEYRQYQRLRDQNEQAGRQLVKEKPWLAEVDRRVGRVRLQMRRADPKLDAILLDWGYVAVPIRERR